MQKGFCLVFAQVLSCSRLGSASFQILSCSWFCLSFPSMGTLTCIFADSMELLVSHCHLNWQMLLFHSPHTVHVCLFLPFSLHCSVWPLSLALVNMTLQHVTGQSTCVLPPRSADWNKTLENTCSVSALCLHSMEKCSHEHATHSRFHY